MKTSIDIPDLIYRKAKIRAMENRQTFRAFLLQVLERELFQPPQAAEESDGTKPGHHEIHELGVPTLKRHENDRTVVTDQWINDLREREGI